MGDPAVIRFLKELRRRRVFRVAGLYVVAIWLVMQAADILFPAWGIPDAAIQFLLWAGILGFPLAVTFGWVFDVSAEGIRRTQPVGSAVELQHSLPLKRADYLILAAFLVVVGLIVHDTTGRVMETATVEVWRPPLAEIEPHSVAVLPFADLSPLGDQGYFTNGISEEILDRLTAFRELKVIARTSSFAFQDSSHDIAAISRLLAVKYLLQGSVRRDGQQLRISAQLIDSGGVQVWSSSFDRELGAIFALQDEIAEAVATSIVPQIVPPAATSRQPDLEAYQHFLVGRELVRQRSWSQYARAIEQLDRAVAIDPGFAEAFAERGVARLLSAQRVFGQDRETWLAQAAQDLDKALSLNPLLGRAVEAQALTLAFREDVSWLEGEGERILRRAIKLDPGSVDARIWLSQLMIAQGREAESEEQLREATRIDPLTPTPNSNLAMREMDRGEFSAAENRLRRLLELPQSSEMGHKGLWVLHLVTGQLAEAFEDALNMGRQILPDRLFDSYLLLGISEVAEAYQDRIEQEDPENLQLGRPRAFLAIHHGRFDEALTFAEQAQDAATDARMAFGWLKAAVGAHEEAIQVLEPFVDASMLRQGGGNAFLAQWLAWAYWHTGEHERAMKVLGDVEAGFVTRDADGRLHRGDRLYLFAMNAQQSGHGDAAIERLQRAVTAGWRNYFDALHDPRWDALRDDPRFVGLMAAVKADVDAQRAEVERRYLGKEPGAWLDAPGSRVNAKAQNR